MSLKIKSFVYLIMLTAGVDSLARGEKCGASKNLKIKFIGLIKSVGAFIIQIAPGPKFAIFYRINYPAKMQLF